MIHNLWNSGNFIFELSQKIHFLSNSTIFTPNSIHKIFTTISTFLCNFHSFKSLTRLLYTSYKTNRTVPTVFHILEQYLGLEKVRVKSSHTLKIIWLDLCALFFAHKDRLHRCWWRIITTKCVGDNYTILMTVLSILITNIYYIFTLMYSVNNIHKSSRTLGHQHHCHKRIL